MHDSYTGADFPAGPQNVSGAAALAFVRQRHGLPRGDLDRILRQQAYLSGLGNHTLNPPNSTTSDIAPMATSLGCVS